MVGIEWAISLLCTKMLLVSDIVNIFQCGFVENLLLNECGQDHRMAKPDFL